MPVPGLAPRSRTAMPASAHALFAAPLADRVGAAALASLPGVGPVRWRALLSYFGGDASRAAAAQGSTPDSWARARDAAVRQLAPTGDETHLLVAGDADYPRALLDLPAAPPLLWVRGDLATLGAAPRVAVVGTREPTASGSHTARRLVGALRGTSACIVSGMARGIDGVAHDAALGCDLPTIAVLGTGVDVPYPAQHRRLYARIVAAGAAVSEQPPGTTAVPGAFPRRNRIIAALAECTVVVEAGERSGALITADIALDLGRTVAAVPGPIDAPASVGANTLLRDGAHVIATVDDLAPLLGFRAPSTRPHSVAADAMADVLHGAERALWCALATPALDPDDAATRAGLTARQCATALAGLELRGAIVTDLTGAIRRL